MTMPRRWIPSAPAVVLALVIIATPATSVAQAIYRCEQDGKVTYTDAPCSRPLIQRIGGNSTDSTPATETVIGGGYVNPYGPWHGQTQFQVMDTGVLKSEGTHFVAPFDIVIAEDGKVVGASAESSCRLLGLASPGYTPKMLNLDLTVSKCPAKVFNQRYRGSLSMNSVKRTAQLNLSAQRIGVGQAVIADIKATMVR